ncbi:MAG: transcription antitermination protein NusB [Bacteroidales bacterium]|nr:transcription antitermination protein NusB [Bacteroidales bacterium]
MLSRRILRIKAFKVLYSYVENPAMNQKEAEAELEHACEATRDLYLFLLAIIGPLTAEAASRIAAAKAKFNPSPEELNPNMKFVENGIARILDADPDFQKICKRKKFSWEQYDVLLRHLYENIRSRDYFQAYLRSSKRSCKEDAALFVRIFEEEFVDNEELEAILEDLSIYWNDDLAYALTYCCRTVEDLARGAGWREPELYQSDMPGKPGRESDRAFVFNLVRTAYRNYDRYVAAIASCTPKWDRSRICATDLALIICGLAEAEKFPQIGYRTTINEFVEISKYYSTPESRAFVNGLLDKLVQKDEHPAVGGAR